MHKSMRSVMSGAGSALVAGVVAFAIVAPAAAQERMVVEPTSHVTWSQIVAAEMMKPSDLIREPRVVRKPAPLPKEIRELGSENLLVLPEVEREQAPAPRSVERSLASLDITESFQGISDNNATIPPDTMGAVGPNHVMIMLNSEVGIQNRTGGQLSRVALSTFWTVGTGIFGSAFDPVLLYDSLSDRWIACTDADAFSTSASIFFAISDTSDPTGGWSFYEIDADPANAIWADFPGFGVNANWIAITNNMFTVASGSFQGVKMWVIDKSTALAGGALTITTFNPGFDFAGNLDGFTMRPAQTFDPGENTLYMIDLSGFSSGGIPLVRLSRITGTGPAPVWSAFPGVFGGANAGSGLYFVANDFNFSMIDASQATTATRVSTNDTRIMNAVVRNGRLWATHAAGLPGVGATDRTAAFWYEFNPAAGAPLVQSGVISGGADTHFFFPSISVNSANDAVVGFSYSDATQFVDAAFAGRLAGDAAGTMRAPELVKEGEDAYIKNFGSGTVRWGDYSATVVDPVDDMSFWTLQQYAETDVGAAETQDRWGLWWARIGGDCPTDLNGDGQTDGADFGLMLGAWGTPGADLTGDNNTDGADLGILLGAWGPC